MPKGRASGSEIDPEILPYLTGAINSSIMMLTIAQVTRRTRRGQAACSGSPERLLTCLGGVRSSLPNSTQGEEREREEKLCFCSSGGPSHSAHSLSCPILSETLCLHYDRFIS